MENPSDKFVITIGRQFGSGGRELGRIIADKLGVDFYDKQLLSQAAKDAGLSTEFFEHNDERTPRFYSGMFSFNLGANPMAWYSGPSSINDDTIYQAQCDFIHKVASNQSCVIVGRSADYVLRDMPNVINVFVHAPIDVCVERIVRRSDCSDPAKARAMALKANKLRANYYNFYTDKKWGDASSYDLTFDSSLLPMDAIADIVIQYLRHRLAHFSSTPSTPAE